MKDFKTLDEQLCILSSRGLIIDDIQAAKDFLLTNNYYRVSGYSLTLRKDDKFYPNTHFQNIVDIYYFDCELRHILLKYIDIIEVSAKSVYVYEFSRVHGPLGYLDTSLFSDPEIHTRIIKKVEQQKETRHPHEAYLKHFIDDLQEYIPLWAYIDLFTISDISFFYSITESSIRTRIAASFGITKHGSELFGKFLKSITIVRNLCAHGSRLYNRLFEQRPSLDKKDFSSLITLPDGQKDNSHLFGFILIMRRLLTNEFSANLKSELIALSSKYPFVRLDYLGFPESWKDILS